MSESPTGAPVSRAKEFFKGFFLPLLFAAAGLATYPLFASYDEKHGISNVGDEAMPLAALLAVVSSLVLIVRWWKRARPRAYGIMAGFLGAPILLMGLFILFITVFKIQLFPN